MTQATRKQRRSKRRRRIRARVSGTPARPRLAVFRSNRHIYAQLINDQSGETIVQANSRELKGDHTMLEAAEAVGKNIAERAQDEGVEQVAFDRSGYNYTGKIAALADSARNAGLDF